MKSTRFIWCVNCVFLQTRKRPQTAKDGDNMQTCVPIVSFVNVLNFELSSVPVWFLPWWLLVCRLSSMRGHFTHMGMSMVGTLRSVFGFCGLLSHMNLIFRFSSPPAWYCPALLLFILNYKRKDWGKKIVLGMQNFLLKKFEFGIQTRGPQALTVTWVSETLHWILVRRVHICISTAPLLQ